MPASGLELHLHLGCKTRDDFFKSHLFFLLVQGDVVYTTLFPFRSHLLIIHLTSRAPTHGGAQGAQDTRAGVSQVLNRLSFSSTLSHLRRLNSPIGREGKLAKPRQLHNSHWGMVCPAETPEVRSTLCVPTYTELLS
jgi:hypothetical protein